MQQQPPPPTLNSAMPLPHNTITTEQIQKYLDDNKNLILAILENHNLGRIAECAQYQAILQKNLMYLAAIADAQPQTSTVPSQPPPTSVAQQGNHMQQNQMSTPQQQGFPIQKLPFQLNPLRSQDQQHQLLHFQQQQHQVQGHIGLGDGANNSMHQMMQPALGNPGSLDLRGNKQGVLEANSGDGPGKSASGHLNADRE